MKMDQLKEFIIDQWGSPTFGPKPCLGGMDLGEVFFGIIHKGRLYFKTDEQTRPIFAAKGMKPFQFNGKQTLKSYYEVPIEVIEDNEQLVDWAKKAGSISSH